MTARRLRSTRAANRVRAFTLIEILIAVAILGILAAIAVPSYSAYLTEARRSDATILLTEAAGEQIRYFSEFNAYTADLRELGYAVADAVPSDGGYYTLSATVDAADPSRFVLTASPVAGGAQANDTACADFTLDHNGVKGHGGTGEDCW